MTPTATSAPPLPACTATPNGTARSVPGRFEWERAVRKARISSQLKGFLLYLGTFMSANGRDCRPSSRTIGCDYEWSRQYVFEILQSAEVSGWIRTDKRPGKPSERLPQIPVEEPVTRQVVPDPTVTGQVQPGGAPPPDPRGPEHPSGTRNGPDTGLTLVPDHNDTKQVTSRPRAPAKQQPLLAAIPPDPDTEHPIDLYQLTLSVEIPPPPPNRYRDELLPALAAQLAAINSGAAS